MNAGILAGSGALYLQEIWHEKANMLRRLGNKSKLLPKLLPLFPENITTFIDMFMGSGAVTFAMYNRAHHLIANDNDENVFNFFVVMREHKEELFDRLNKTPLHEKVFEYLSNSETKDDIDRALKFIILSNFSVSGFSGSGGLRFDFERKNLKMAFIDGVGIIENIITTAFFMCSDFRDVLAKIACDKTSPSQKNNAFIYADPPYLGTSNNYAESFTEQDTRDLFSILTSSGIRFALSEFRHPLVMALAEEHGLHVTSLGERRNLKNRREEILITNYQPERRQGSLFPI